MPRARYWADLATTDFAELPPGRTIAVLPVAAVEQHGPHLPLSVDTDLAQGIVQACLPQVPEALSVLFLPVQAVGFSPEHQGFAGTLSLRAETVIRLWTELAESVAASGVRKLLIVNTHGGQVGLLDVVGRDLRARLGMLVYTTSWFQWPLCDAQGQDLMAQISAEEQRFGIHAGQVETAMMLALRPEQVRQDRAAHFPSHAQTRAQSGALLGNGRSAKLAWQIQDYNPLGAVGHAALARAELGQALVQACGRALAQLLVEIDGLPDDTLRPAPNAQA